MFIILKQASLFTDRSELNVHLNEFCCEVSNLWLHCSLHSFHTCKYPCQGQTVAGDADHHGDDFSDDWIMFRLVMTSLKERKNHIWSL